MSASPQNTSNHSAKVYFAKNLLSNNVGDLIKFNLLSTWSCL